MDYLLGSRTFHLSTSRNPFSAPRAMVTASSRRRSLASPPRGYARKLFLQFMKPIFQAFSSGPILSQDHSSAKRRRKRRSGSVGQGWAFCWWPASVSAFPWSTRSFPKVSHFMDPSKHLVLTSKRAQTLLRIHYYKLTEVPITNQVAGAARGLQRLRPRA